MSILDKAPEANRNYAENDDPTLRKQAKLSASTGDVSPAPMRFFSYKNPEENTRDQTRRVRSHPWIAKDISVCGFIFDVDTGRLRELLPIAPETAA